MEIAKKIVLIIFGNLLLSFGVVAFMIPHHIIIGGSTGIASFMQYYCNIPLSYTVMFINIFMFIAGYIALGKKFALSTVLSTFVYPVFLNYFQSIDSLSILCKDIVLAALYGGVLIGCGIGLIMKAGASSGGMDIPLLILNKRLNIPVGSSMIVCDSLILIGQMTFSNTTEILYGIAIVFIISSMINRVLTSGVSEVQMIIISPKFEEIRNLLIYQHDNGVTMIEIETGMNHIKQKAVLVVMSNRKVQEIKRTVLSVDNYAFILISRITEVSGRGFSLDRYVD